MAKPRRIDRVGRLTGLELPKRPFLHDEDAQEPKTDESLPGRTPYAWTTWHAALKAVVAAAIRWFVDISDNDSIRELATLKGDQK